MHKTTEKSASKLCLISDKPTTNRRKPYSIPTDRQSLLQVPERARLLPLLAFLFRSVKNERVKALADYLEKNGVPVYSPRSDMFFEREEIKLLIGVLLVAFPNYLRSMQTDKYMPKVMSDYFQGKCLPAFAEFQRANPTSPLIKWCAKKGLEHSNPNASFD